MLEGEILTKVPPLILVVDDEPDICYLVQCILEKEGYRVTTAYDGNGALELIQKLKPDMVVLDFLLPDIDGVELCHRIRKVSNCRIVYFTGRMDFKLTRQDADGFIDKPANMKQILSVVGDTLARL